MLFYAISLLFNKSSQLFGGDDDFDLRKMLYGLKTFFWPVFKISAVLSRAHLNLNLIETK